MYDHPVLMQVGSALLWLGVGVALIAVLVFLALAWRYLSLWVQSISSRAGVGLVELVMMQLRKVDARTIVSCKIQLVKAGIRDISTNDLESHYLAVGRVPERAQERSASDRLHVARTRDQRLGDLVTAMVAANRAALDLDWKRACAIDLAGRDVLDAINTSVYPKVIDVPNQRQGKTTIDAVAKDGIQLKAKARVTVRTNIRQLIGGATEETVIARVGEGIVSAIGSAESHKQVLENPDRISKAVLARGLDSGTAFEILSIDIADVDVGENIGAILQANQAEADKRRFQAEAEKRRAMAIATAAENRARVEENRALVVLAEAEVPKAMAEAFRVGNLGIMDYYRMKNIQADTTMRASIGGEAGDQKKST